MLIDDQLISDLTNSHKSYINQISIGYQLDIYPIDDLLIEIQLVAYDTKDIRKKKIL